MLKGFKIALILVLFSNNVFSQEDSVKSQIMKYEDSKSTVISKGRKLILDKFINGELDEVKKVKNYLVKTEDNDYVAFYPAEYWLILYWTKDYAELANEIQNFDASKVASFNRKIQPLNDMLYSKLIEKSLENEVLIKTQIHTTELDEETKQILILNFEYLLLENRNDPNAQDSLNTRAEIFLDKYSSGNYENYTKNYIRYQLVPKNWGLAFEFFTGYGINTGNLSKNYSNNIPIGVAFDICYKNFELYLRDYIGFNKTKKDIDYSLGTFKKGSRTMVFLPEASLGYVAYNTNRFKLAPFAGIASTSVTPPTKKTEDTPELEEVALDFTTTYVLGINFDIKFGPKNTPKYSPKTSYSFMRIRYGYSMPTFDKKYPEMSGNMHYITVGFGGMARGLKRAD